MEKETVFVNPIRGVGQLKKKKKKLAKINAVVQTAVCQYVWKKSDGNGTEEQTEVRIAMRHSSVIDEFTRGSPK